MHPYVTLAKEAIEKFVLHGQTLRRPPTLSPEMQKKAGVFVSLKIHGQLRGCIGTFMPTCDSLFEEIARNAVGAATEDPRFAPVTPDELGQINYSVDVLTPPESVKSASELDPKKFGIIVAKGRRRGLLLPDLEGVNTVEEQLRITKMKAGIPPSDPDVDIFRFTVERYK